MREGLGELSDEGGSLGERRSNKVEMDGIHRAGVNLNFSWRKNLFTGQSGERISVLPLGILCRKNEDCLLHSFTHSFIHSHIH